jgi:Uma2 family endonuclease
MVLMTREPDASAKILRDFLSLETPEGYRAELIDGEIVVTPPPYGNHERCAMQIIKQVLVGSGTPMDFSEVKGLNLATGGADAYVIPDITFAPTELDLFLDAPPWMPSSGVSMVVEVTSSSPERDRNAKRRAYAAATVPLYLLVDREQRQVTLFSNPVRNDYSTTSVAAFGDRLKLPAPFSFTLDTENFTA